jgi:hypothetical protein
VIKTVTQGVNFSFNCPLVKTLLSAPFRHPSDEPVGLLQVVEFEFQHFVVRQIVRRHLECEFLPEFSPLPDLPLAEKGAAWSRFYETVLGRNLRIKLSNANLEIFY